MTGTESFRSFVAAHGLGLSRTAFLLTGEHVEAEDLLQQALVKAAAQWRRLSAMSDADTRVRTIMLNRLRDWRRRKPFLTSAFELIEGRPRTDQPGEAELSLMLRQVLCMLSPQERIVLYLRSCEDLSEDGVAARLSCSIETIQRHTRDALEYLRATAPELLARGQLADLRDAYHRLERDARDYADADRALRALQHRRVVRSAVGAALAILVIAAGFGLQQWPTRGSGERIAVDPGATRSASPGLVPALPASGPVGVAEAVYRSCRNSCPTLLALADGREYMFGEPTINPDGNITLSPDGRWLGMPTASGYELRDLRGDIKRVVAAPLNGRAGNAYSPWVWSPDSRRLVLGYHASGAVSEYAEVDLDSGAVATPRLPNGYEPVGILSSGAWVLLDESQYGEVVHKQVRLRVQDSTVVFAATGQGYLSDADHGLSVEVGGDRIYLLEYTQDKVAILEFDLAGKLVERKPLADGQFASGPTQRGYAIIEAPANRRTGHMRLLVGDRVLREFPGEAEIVIPGSARH